jgi:predicted CXXCH cytochrome family protein
MWRLALVAIAGIALLIGAVTYWRGWNSKPDSHQTADVSGVTSVGEKHVGPDYVGIAACAKCHAAEYSSYQKTAHSLALSEPDARKEPPGGSFHHEATGRTYTVYREGDRWRHRESALDEPADEQLKADYPVRYLIGSGHHTRSYLIEQDGFLFESPLTWYESRKSWGMSPGYDRPNHRGFERAADATCLFCHVGRMEATDIGFQRFTFPEQPIGCERCHGPGSLHVAEQESLQKGKASEKAQRGTIVNPGKLSRALVEDICAQCHLNGDAMVTLRDRTLLDFRPGQPLSDVCIEYRPQEPTLRMKVVGHNEQLRLSRCYEASETLVCTTCHDPHATTAPERRRARYVEACLKCHKVESCRLDSAERLKISPDNDCITCHMPQVPTEIQHVAFTHHRIGIHRKESAAPVTSHHVLKVSDLVPTIDVAKLPLHDRLRNLGLAYFAMSQKQEDPEAAEAYRERARKVLNNARSQTPTDGELDAAFARLMREREPVTAMLSARKALLDPKLSAKSRVNSLFLIAELGIHLNRINQETLKSLQELTTVRRLSEDWRMLSVCQQRSGDLAAALRSMQKAIEIAPFRPELHTDSATLQQQLGNKDASEHESSIAKQLSRLSSQRN